MLSSYIQCDKWHQIWNDMTYDTERVTLWHCGDKRRGIILSCTNGLSAEEQKKGTAFISYHRYTERARGSEKPESPPPSKRKKRPTKEKNRDFHLHFRTIIGPLWIKIAWKWGVNCEILILMPNEPIVELLWIFTYN